MKEKLKGLWNYLYADDRKLKTRILLALCGCIPFVLTFMFTPIVETFLANTRFFSYTVSQLLVPVSIFAFGIAAVLFGISFALRGRIFNWYVSLLVGLSLAAQIQGLFMNKSVGVLDGTEVVWKDMSTSAVLGLAVWFFIVFLVFFIAQYSKKIWKYTVMFLCLFLCVMQVTNIATIALTSEIDKKSPYKVTREGEFDLSQKHNVIVLVVDTFDIRYAQEVMDNSPEYFEEFDGFTWYKNTMSHYSRTFPSVAYLFTGVEYKYEIPYDDYMKKAWENTTIFEDMRSAGYVPRVYINEHHVNTDLEYMAQYVDNYRVIEPEIYERTLIKEMMTLSMYRTAPVALKPFFETDTTQLNSAYALKGNKGNSLTDMNFYKRLTSETLTVSETFGEQGTFTYYHFKGCHAPYVFDEDCKKSDEKLTVEDATRGALTNVNEYLRQLKELGVYDSSTIIVMGDHAKSGTMTELDRERAVSLFVKPAGSTGEMKTSESPQQLINVTATVLKSMGLDYSKYGTPVEDVKEDAEITRYFYMSASNKELTKREEDLVTYEVTGDAKDFSNWKIVDRIKIKYPYLQG